MKYALVLAGGGTRGAFEAGVWKALREMGLNISAICGTSIGAVNGALFISNADAQQVWKNIRLSDIASVDCKCCNLLSPPMLTSVLKNRSELDLSPLKNLLAAHISEHKIRRSDILYGLCTYNIDKKKSVELFINEIPSGQLIEYIAASACFPCFEPVKINGDSFTDGGIQNNLPINMLIKRGFDTIISVSVKGVGFVQDINHCGINIIEVNCASPAVGLMEFDRRGIENSITDGYLSCMKAFGRLCGNNFTFDTKSYNEATAIYGTGFPDKLECAAKELKINPYRVYSVYDLAQCILQEYRMNPLLRQLTGLIRNNKNDLLHHTLDLLGETFVNANTVVYMSKHPIPDKKR